MKAETLNLLKSCKIFSSIQDDELERLVPNFETVYLPKNKILFHQGDPATNLYFLVKGKLSTTIKTRKNEEKFIAEILPGEPVGEFAALSYEPRSSTVKALSASTLLKLSGEMFVELCHKHPAVSLEIINSVFERARELIKLVSTDGVGKKHIAFVAAHKKNTLKKMYTIVKPYIESLPNLVSFSDFNDEIIKPDSASLQQEIHEHEGEHKIILYFLQSYNSSLAKICLEKIDMMYVVADGTAEPFISSLTLKHIDSKAHYINPELILLYPDGQHPPQNTAKWLKLANFHLHHHVRINRDCDWKRLLRFITGNAIGLILGGGGLRCWAHLGAILALQKNNIPIDVIGGTSAGAIVGGYHALHESSDDPLPLRELAEITRQAIRIKNVTWPAVSIFNSAAYTEKLQSIFNEVKIENLWIPFFCIASNLSNNKQVIFKTGYLWKGIRASTAVPAVFPPVVINGKLHIDGGILNNLPVDIMKKYIGPTGINVAVELTHKNEDKSEYNFPPVLPFIPTALAKLKISNKDYKFPHFVDTFLKSLLAGSSAKQEENSLLADILVAPDLSKFGLLNVKRKQENRLIRIGYKIALKAIKQWKETNNLIPFL